VSRAADQLVSLAAAGRLYPSVILSGGEMDDRLELAGTVGQTLLCAEPEAVRPCGSCRHCRRIGKVVEAAKTPAPKGRKGSKIRAKDPGVLHPDFLLIKRDLATAISVDAVKELLRTAQVSPFEARGQVFVIAEAESLNPAGANALLKTLEEPADRAPRNFLLLTPSPDALLPTLRSRSLTVYLGTGDAVEADDELRSDLVELWRRRPGEEGSALWISELTDRLVAVGDFEDVRSRQGWTRIAAGLTEASAALEDGGQRAAALALAADFLDAHRLRLRSIQPRRIIEGLAARRLRPGQPETGFGSLVDALIGPW